MIKPDSLRAALTTVFPELKTDPGRLHLWIEEGHVRCHAADPAVGEQLGFTLEYTLKVWIEGWTRSQLMVWIVLIDWLRIQQPDLLTPAKSKTGIPFESDILSENAADIGFDLPLTEPVRAVRRQDGGFDMQVIAEPEPMVPDSARMVAGGELLKTIFVDGAQLVPPPPDND